MNQTGTKMKMMELIRKIVREEAKGLKETTLTERQFKGLEGIPPNVPLQKATKAQKMKIIQSPGNVISFNIPEEFKGKRHAWQVPTTGKIKKGMGGVYLEGKINNSPLFKSVDDLIAGVNWKQMEEFRKSNM